MYLQISFNSVINHILCKLVILQVQTRHTYVFTGKKFGLDFVDNTCLNKRVSNHVSEIINGKVNV